MIVVCLCVQWTMCSTQCRHCRMSVCVQWTMCSTQCRHCRMSVCVQWTMCSTQCRHCRMSVCVQWTMCSTQCRQRIAVGADRCSSDSCLAAVMSYSSSVLKPCLAEASYDIRVTLSDHTGSIPRCIIAGPVAEKMLGITV